MEFSKHNWATISEKIGPEMPLFGKQASWTLFFQNILANPMISEISFLCRHTFKFSIAQCHSGAVLRLTASQWYSRVIIQFSVFVWLDSINIWLYQGPLFFLLIQEDRRASAERTSIIELVIQLELIIQLSHLL